MTNQATKCFMKWVGDQSVDRWAKFTLEFPRFKHPDQWEVPLRRTFRVLEKTYPKTSLKRYRKRSLLLPLRYVTHLGDDKTKGVAMHAQGLIEVLDDPDLTRLKNALHKAWVSSVKQQLQHQRWTNPNDLIAEATLWLEPLEGGTKEYSVYLNRFEGNQLGFGVEKLVLSATSLMND